MSRLADFGPAQEACSAGPPAPCRAHCPVGTDAAAYVALIAEGRTAEAYDVARAPNPFASICGRICTAPCERGCRRGIIDRPIAIRAAKRFLTERHGVEAGEHSRWSKAIPHIPEATRPSVGIIGAGPAGLAAAHDLRLAGHAVTLYEREDKPGGMLTYGAPSFRLPRDVADAEFQAIIDLGVTLKTGCVVGSTVAIESLLEAHAAILVAVGCQVGRPVPIPGVELDGVLHAVDFLRRVHGPPPGSAAPLHGPFLVVGGGSVAFDAARSAGHLHARDAATDRTLADAQRRGRRRGLPASTRPVTLVAPETPDQSKALPEEREHAQEEGVHVRAGFGVRRILGDDRVEGVEIAPVLSLFDEHGHFAPRLADDETEVIAARTVILAVGQRADTSFLASVAGIETASWGGVQPDRHGRTAHPRIFAAGDVATGPRDLIDAVASGQRAAAAIVHALAGARDDAPPPRAILPAPVPQAPPYRAPRRYWSAYDVTPRAAPPRAAVNQRTVAVEVEASLPRAAAQREAHRCFRCDEQLQLSTARCIACALCVDVCPHGSLALEKVSDAVQLTFDHDSCIRCRFCVDRCPADALDFSR